MKVKVLKFTKKITDFTKIHIFHGRRPISRKMSRPWNHELSWSLAITLEIETSAMLGNIYRMMEPRLWHWAIVTIAWWYYCSH